MRDLEIPRWGHGNDLRVTESFVHTITGQLDREWRPEKATFKLYEKVSGLVDGTSREEDFKLAKEGTVSRGQWSLAFSRPNEIDFCASIATLETSNNT